MTINRRIVGSWSSRPPRLGNLEGNCLAPAQAKMDRFGGFVDKFQPIRDADVV